MAFVIRDRVRETSTTTGTGSFTLAGAVTGYQTFDAVLDTNDTTYYTIADQSGANWEVGIGTFTAPATLARTTILSSSNGGSVVTFGAGTKDVFISLPASKTNTNDQPNVIAVNSTSDALRITQAGTGNALVVEDAANPDATPFVINASGNVGIGTTSPDALLTVNTIASFGAGAAALPSIAAKGDLDTGLWFPASNTIAASTGGTERLRIDSSGTATFTGALVPASSFLRNRIINGGMEIAQRGTSGTSGYLLDRWITSSTSAQSQSSDAPTGFINSLEFTSSSATFPNLAQRIERLNSYDLAGRVVTFSFWAKSVSGSSNLYVEIYRANANDNFSSVTLEGLVILTASPSASWTFYSGSITLSASATTGVELRIIRGNTSAASTRVTGVQLEVGSAATPFERRQFGQELALCQRYYQENQSLQGAMNSGNSSFVTQGFGFNMRATPTYVLINGTSKIHYPGIAFYNVTSIDSAAPSYVTLFSSTNFGANSAAQLLPNAISASAEL